LTHASFASTMLSRSDQVPVHETADDHRPVHETVQAPVEHRVELDGGNKPDHHQEDKQERHPVLIGEGRLYHATSRCLPEVSKPDPGTHGQAGTYYLPRICTHDQKRPQVVEHQMLQAMCEEQALGGIIDAGVQ